MRSSRAPGRRGIRSPGVIIGLTSIGAGIILLAVALDAAVRYSPYGDPGAGSTALWCGIYGLGLIAVPVVIAIAEGIAIASQAYRDWKASLSPGERAALSITETAALLGADAYMAGRNRKTSEKLTASVMGPEGEK